MVLCWFVIECLTAPSSIDCWLVFKMGFSELDGAGPKDSLDGAEYVLEMSDAVTET